MFLFAMFGMRSILLVRSVCGVVEYERSAAARWRKFFPSGKASRRVCHPPFLSRESSPVSPPPHYASRTTRRRAESAVGILIIIHATYGFSILCYQARTGTSLAIRIGQELSQPYCRPPSASHKGRYCGRCQLHSGIYSRVGGQKGQAGLVDRERWWWIGELSC